MPDIIRGTGQPETRQFATDLQIRGDLSDGRTVVGIAVPYNQPTEIRDFMGSYTELMAPSVFKRSIAERGPSKVKVLGLHDSRVMPLGRAAVLDPDHPEGLYAELAISKTRAGDESLELIRDGALDSLSVGFSPVTSVTDEEGRVVRTEAKLHEISLVPFPAYEGAKIAGVRSADASRLAELVRADMPLPADVREALAKVLDLIAQADEAVDAAQPALAEVLNVPNPDDDEAARAYLQMLALRQRHDADLLLRFTA